MSYIFFVALWDWNLTLNMEADDQTFMHLFKDAFSISFLEAANFSYLKGNLQAYKDPENINILSYFLAYKMCSVNIF